MFIQLLFSFASSFPDIKQSNDPNYKIIPLKYDLEDVDMDGDVTERSTASIKSSSSQVKSQFDDADTKIDINHDEMETMKKSNSGGHLKRFIDNIRNNCKSTDTVVERKFLFVAILFSSNNNNNLF